MDERPLHVASTWGVIEEITALTEAGADVNAAGELGNTPLHEAVGQDHLEAVRFLLERGAGPTAENKDGLTPLDIARLRKQFRVAALLEARRDGQT